MEVAEKVIDGIGNVITNNRISNYIYTTRLWNKIRRGWWGTDMCDFSVERGDIVIGVERDCIKEEGEIICKHMVEYKYNGIIQKELLPKNVILKMCRQTGFYLDQHFSVVERLKRRIQMSIFQ